MRAFRNQRIKTCWMTVLNRDHRYCSRRHCLLFYWKGSLSPGLRIYRARWQIQRDDNKRTSESYLCRVFIHGVEHVQRHQKLRWRKTQRAMRCTAQIFHRHHNRHFRAARVSERVTVGVGVRAKKNIVLYHSHLIWFVYCCWLILIQRHFVFCYKIPNGIDSIRMSLSRLYVRLIATRRERTREAIIIHLNKMKVKLLAAWKCVQARAFGHGNIRAPICIWMIMSYFVSLNSHSTLSVAVFFSIRRNNETLCSKQTTRRL